jgi:hypothetical protein
MLNSSSPAAGLSKFRGDWEHFSERTPWNALALSGHLVWVKDREVVIEVGEDINGAATKKVGW